MIVHRHEEGTDKVFCFIAFIRNFVLGKVAVQIHDTQTDGMHFTVRFRNTWRISYLGHIADRGERNHTLVNGFADFAMLHHIYNVQRSQITAHVPADGILLAVICNFGSFLQLEDFRA
ncbi:hypothetical protein D1872_224590 [compost metagenome]